MKTNIANYVKYFKVLEYKTDLYFAQFVLCEFFNFLILIFNFCLTNIFLGREFSTYGTDVLNYYTTDTMVRRDQKMINPMCNIFPTKWALIIDILQLDVFSINKSSKIILWITRNGRYKQNGQAKLFTEGPLGDSQKYHLSFFAFKKNLYFD